MIRRILIFEVCDVKQPALMGRLSCIYPATISLGFRLHS